LKRFVAAAVAVLASGAWKPAKWPETVQALGQYGYGVSSQLQLVVVIFFTLGTPIGVAAPVCVDCRHPWPASGNLQWEGLVGYDGSAVGGSLQL
jgi:hypothetical protein